MSNLPKVDESPFCGAGRDSILRNTNSPSHRKKRGPLSNIASFMSPQSLSFENERENAAHNTFPWQQILFANLAFAGVALLLYGTYCMFSTFFIPLLWGTIVALLLREVRSSLESHLISLNNWWVRLHAWTSPPDAVFALQCVVGAVNFLAGIVPEWIARFIAFAFSRKQSEVTGDIVEHSRTRIVLAETPESRTFEPGSTRNRTQRKTAVSTLKKRQRSPQMLTNVEMSYRNAASYRHHMVVLMRISCSWLLATSVGPAISLIAVTAIVVLQFVLQNIAMPFIGSRNALVLYLSLIFNRFCLFTTFVGAVALLSSGSSSGIPLLLYVTSILFKSRIQVILKYIPLQSVVLVLIFFVTTVVFAIALYLTLWNVYHELRWTYNGARDGVASYLQFLPSDAVDVLTQQILQWSNFSSISNAALDFFKNDLVNGNISRIWSDAQHTQDQSSNTSQLPDPVVLMQTYLGPFASWIPESLLLWVSPVMQQMHARAHVYSLYSQLSDAYSQLTSYGYVTSVLSYAKAMLMDFSGYSFAFFLSFLLQSVSHMYNVFVFTAIFFTSSWFVAPLRHTSVSPPFAHLTAPTLFRYLLTVEDDPIASSLQAFSGMLNMKKVVKEKLADFLRHSVLRVAEVTLAGSAAAFLCTWLVHSFAMSHVKVLPSLIAAVFSALQLCPAQVVSMPCLIVSTSSLWKSLCSENMSRGTALQLLMLMPQLYIVLYAQSDLNCQIYSSLSHSSSTTGSSSPYWLSLFVAGGLLTFGLHGIIVGPLFFCVFSAMKIYYDYDRSDSTGDVDADFQDPLPEDVAAAAAETPQLIRQ